MTHPKYPAPEYQDQAVEDALRLQDTAALTALIEQGLPADWRCCDNRPLLHYAACWGDTALVDLLLVNGADLTARDAAGLTAYDIADAMAHESLLPVLKTDNEPQPALPAACRSLADLRRLSAAGPVDYMAQLAQKGGFDSVVALALGDTGDSLTAADLLRRDEGSADTVLHLLCASGQLPQIMTVALWAGKPDDLAAVWAEVPVLYRQGIDFETLSTRLRQQHLLSLPRPRFSAPQPG